MVSLSSQPRTVERDMGKGLRRGRGRESQTHYHMVSGVSVFPGVLRGGVQEGRTHGCRSLFLAEMLLLASK